MSRKTKFDYEAVKMAYTMRVEFRIKDNDLDMWTRDKISKLIESMAASNTPIKHILLSHPIDSVDVLDAQKVAVEVELAYEDGAPVLTLADSNVQILPYEDCFDMFVDLHLRNSHAGVNDMNEILKNYYYITDSIYLESFVDSCNVCAQRRLAALQRPCTSTHENDAQNLNFKVHIMFLEMNFINPAVNNEFKYLMVYRQVVSDYILLRPLIDLLAEEVAAELYNIFADFGPPKKITTTHLAFLEDVLKLLKQTPLKYSCKLYEKQTGADSLRLYVTGYINEWMKKCNNPKWAAACYFVQYVINNVGVKSMRALFGPRKGQNAINHFFEEQEPIPSTSGADSSSVKSLSLDSKDSPSTCTKDVLYESDHNSQCLDIESMITKVVKISETSTEGLVKVENQICHICERVIMYNIQTCSKCKVSIHLFCGARFAFNDDTCERTSVYCNNCRDMDQLTM